MHHDQSISFPTNELYQIGDMKINTEIINSFNSDICNIANIKTQYQQIMTHEILAHD